MNLTNPFTKNKFNLNNIKKLFDYILFILINYIIINKNTKIHILLNEEIILKII